MAKPKIIAATLGEYAFFEFLWQFYGNNRGRIRKSYRDLSKKYLDFNDPERNPKAYLRKPQFEALEIYIFLKEYLDNAKVEQIFKEWFERTGKFLDRDEKGVANQLGQVGLFENITKEQYKSVFAAMRKNSRAYANYIFALTMGTGKTILMATCIFYEFIVANKWPKDKRFCHNALVFAPDRTVLISLREIESFDLARVVPPEYVSFLTAHIRFHYLEETGTSLDTLDKSMFNVIVSNTQKIILKRQNKERSAVDDLFGKTADTFKMDESVYGEAADLYNFNGPEDEAGLTTNQRFEKLTRLEQLGIYIDEAHHAFGKALAKDMGIGAKEDDTSLRTTVDMLAARLERAGTHVVACYNYTGTPYVGRDVLPEVVYAYGLREAIDKGYLKQVTLHAYENTKTEEFLEVVVNDFLIAINDLRPEGTLPKLAIFGSTVDEVRNELKPALEKILLDKGIPASRILVNMGDTETTNDDIREFIRLDNPLSEKQFILLVNKGREGWNCRSLFGVAMYRAPKSKIFVLQATMRCLRAIGEVQHTGQVYLSDENLQILNEELQQNFRITAEDLQKTAKEKELVEIRVNKQPKLKLRRVRRSYKVHEKKMASGFVLFPEKDDKDKWFDFTKKYNVTETIQYGMAEGGITSQIKSKTNDLTHIRHKLEYSEIMLVSEVSRYLNKSPLIIENILENTSEMLLGLLDLVNEYNELLYDQLIPRLFKEMYEVEASETAEEHEVELIKLPPQGYYEMRAEPKHIVRDTDKLAASYKDKSFHLDTYCFDSQPEQQLFWDLLQEGKVKEIYFTGMLTHGQSEFFVQYIDPDSRAVRTYYPDFIFQKDDDSYVIVEVKGDNKWEDPIVNAKKEFAQQMAVASGMEYKMIKGSDAVAREYRRLL